MPQSIRQWRRGGIKGEEMKATITFNLPEEKDDHFLALNGAKYYSCLFTLDQEMRSIIKHGHDFKAVEDLAEHIRDFIRESVDLDEVS